jgi:hypothetical protein
MRGGLRRGTSGHAALGMSAALMMLLSTLWRCAIAILPDVTGNAAHEALGGLVGRAGEWLLLLAAALTAWALYVHQKHLVRSSSGNGVPPRTLPRHWRENARCGGISRPVLSRQSRRRHVPMPPNARRRRRTQGF